MIYLDLVSVSVPLAFFAVKVTVYFPVLLYICTGSLAVENVPSPKLHFHEAGIPLVLSVNITFSGTFPTAGAAEKSAIGAFKELFTYI